MAVSSPCSPASDYVENGGDSHENPAVTLFREYLRIPSVSRGEDYQEHYAQAVKFIQDLVEDICLPYEVIEIVPGNKIVLVTVKGTNPDLKSVLLNSHYDVVPVFPEFWQYDAFAAHKDENGDIYARGSQDMKCCTLWHLEAIRRLKKSGAKFPRTLYVTVMPDEEIGGALGMQAFTKTERFKELNIGFALDEGLANPTDAVTVYYGEKSAYWLQVTCTGNPGHGSRFIENTAVDKLEKVLRSALAHREEQKTKLHTEPCLKLGDVTTLNVTKINGGVAANVVPTEFEMVIDMRLSPRDDHEAILKMVQGWLDEAGEGCTLKRLITDPKYPMTPTDDTDPWWKAFTTACVKHSLKIEKEIFPAGTDSRYLRAMGIPCLGFSPLNHTPILLHDHNERVNERIFLTGIDIFVDVIACMANV